MESLDEIIKKEKLVLVDFHALWCGPCKTMSFIVEELEKEFDGTVHFVKVNTDKDRKAVRKYRIKTIPTFILFKEGESVWRKTGAMKKSTISKHITENID